MLKISIPVKRLSHADGLELPNPASLHSAGCDLRAAVPDDDSLALAPGARAVIPTGLQIAIPEGYEGQVRPRSGLAVRKGVTVLNSPGTIDSDYRGEVKVALINHGDEPFIVQRGERIAQLVVAPYAKVEWSEDEAIESTARGVGGFGSTGS